ncbi:hypothetical protein NHQ30_011294 [Ciborinia camelliae]|nr:hypothetical protein NHQ30_011294 [Ciborinia camelliae]
MDDTSVSIQKGSLTSYMFSVCPPRDTRNSLGAKISYYADLLRRPFTILLDKSRAYGASMRGVFCSRAAGAEPRECVCITTILPILVATFATALPTEVLTERDETYCVPQGPGTCTFGWQEWEEQSGSGFNFYIILY